jgi:F420H(2)-dependent quinone reductase
MAVGLISDERLRAMYRGGQGNTTARRFARLWAMVFGWGVLPRRWVTLQVPGRRSGRTTSFPLGLAFHNGDRFLVSMLGDGCNWVRNVRAAGGSAVLRRRRAEPVRLVEVPAAERAPIIKSYLQQVPGARPHIRVDRRRPVAAFASIGAQIPVFRVTAREPDS